MLGGDNSISPGTSAALPEDDSRRVRRDRPATALGGILLVGLLLRVWMLTGQSLSNDEVEDLRVALESDTWSETLFGAKRFPPAYHLAVRAWSLVWEGDTGARAFSVVVGLLFVVVMWRIGLAVGNERTALATAAMTALSPFAVWYSQETRVYGLYLLLAGLFVWRLLTALETDRRRDWIIAGVSAAAGVYVHYYFGLLVAIAILAVATFRPSAQTTAAAASNRLTGLAVAGLGVIPAAALWLRDIQGEWGFASQSSFGVPELGYSYVSMFTGYTLGPSLRALHELDTAEAIVGFLPWIALTAIPGYILTLIGWRRLAQKPLSRRLMVLAAGVPVLAVGLVSLAAPFGFNVRHTVWIFIPIFALLGLAMDDPRGWVKVSFALVAVTSLVAIGNRHLSVEHRTEDVAQLAPSIESEPGLPVFVISGYMADPVAHYLSDADAVVALPDIAADGTGLDAALASLDADSAYWIVASRTFHGDPSGHLIEALEGQIEEKARYAGVALYRSVP